MQVCHDYSDKQVHAGYLGGHMDLRVQPRGAEGQECRWVALADLLVADNSDYQFPAANKPGYWSKRLD